MKNTENVFIEDVEDEKYYPDWIDKYLKYHLLFEREEILLIDKKCYNKCPISVYEFDLKPLKAIAPNYMMEPSVTVTNK